MILFETFLLLLSLPTVFGADSHRFNRLDLPPLHVFNKTLNITDFENNTTWRNLSRPIPLPRPINVFNDTTTTHDNATIIVLANATLFNDTTAAPDKSTMTAAGDVVANSVPTIDTSSKFHPMFPAPSGNTSLPVPVNRSLPVATGTDTNNAAANVTPVTVSANGGSVTPAPIMTTTATHGDNGLPAAVGAAGAAGLGAGAAGAVGAGLGLGGGVGGAGADLGAGGGGGGGGGGEADTAETPNTNDGTSDDHNSNDDHSDDDNVTNHVTNLPITTHPVTTQPITTRPVTAQPITTRPVTTQPITTQPITTTAPVTSACPFNDDLSDDWYPADSWDLNGQDYPAPRFDILEKSVIPVTISTVVSATPAAALSIKSVQILPNRITLQPKTAFTAAIRVPTGPSVCTYKHSGLGSDPNTRNMYTIINVQGWAGPNGVTLHKNIMLCGTVTNFVVSHGSATFAFDLDGNSMCIVDAITTTGGHVDDCTVDSSTGVIQTSKRLRSRVYKNNYQSPSQPEKMGMIPAPNYFLSKRGGILSSLFKSVIEPTDIPDDVWISATIPGVDQCLDRIHEKATVGPGRTSLFYTGWAAKPGFKFMNAWARRHCELLGPVVSWNTIVDKQWILDVQKAISRPLDIIEAPISEQYAAGDKALKNLAQAFGEASAGDVYVFIEKGQGDWDPKSAWGSYEYPALTRNPNIRNIYRVDLDLTEDPAQSMSDPDRAGPNNPQGTPVLIWKQGDPPSDVEPAGDRARKNVIHSPLTEVFPVPLGSGLKRRRIQG